MPCITADSNDILEITRRVEALSALLDSADGKNLLAGYKRAANILAAEEKKDGKTYAAQVDPQTPEAPRRSRTSPPRHQPAPMPTSPQRPAPTTTAAPSPRSQRSAPRSTPSSKPSSSTTPTPAIRANRLHLLAALRDTMHLVADFSKIAG